MDSQLHSQKSTEVHLVLSYETHKTSLTAHHVRKKIYMDIIKIKYKIPNHFPSHSPICSPVCCDAIATPKNSHTLRSNKGKNLPPIFPDSREKNFLNMVKKIHTELPSPVSIKTKP